MTDLLDKKISEEVGLDIDWKDGKLRLEMKYDGKGADGGVFMEADAEYLIKKIAEKILSDEKTRNCISPSDYSSL